MHNRYIWLLREPRTGSSWLASHLQDKLNLKMIFIDEMPEFNKFPADVPHPNHFPDDVRLIGTHYFVHLMNLSNFDNPLVIRTTRRSKSDRCISMLYSKIYGTWHWRPDVLSEKTLQRTLENPMYVTKQKVKVIMENFKSQEDEWFRFCDQYETNTVVYEDLFDGVYIPGLNTTVKFSDDSSKHIKFPDRTRAFINYEEIVKWCSEYEDSMGFKKYE